MGLVSMSVPDEAVEGKAVGSGGPACRSSAGALRWTKHTLNHWRRQATPILDARWRSLIGFAGPERPEGIDAFFFRSAGLSSIRHSPPDRITRSAASIEFVEYLEEQRPQPPDFLAMHGRKRGENVIGLGGQPQERTTTIVR